MPPTNLPTSGYLRPETTPRLTGPGHGGTESGKSLTANADVARGWLLAQPGPEAADKALLTSVRSSLGVEVSIKTEWRFPEGEPAYQLPITASIAAENPDNIPAAIARIEGALTGPEKTQAEDWLLMLQTACAGGRKSEVNMHVALDLYSGSLCRFPADVARAACAELATKPRDSTAWFPTLPELLAVCERYAAPRAAMLAGLKTFRLPTEEERRKDQARALMFEAKEAEDEAFLCRRSKPERYAELITFADECRRSARKLTQGGG